MSTWASPASASRRAASSATYAPRRLSSAFDTIRPFGSSSGSPCQTPASPGADEAAASSRSFAPMSMWRSSCSSAAVAESLRRDALARDHARERAVPGQESNRWPAASRRDAAERA